MRVVLELPTNSVWSVTAIDTSRDQTVTLPNIGPSSPPPTTGYYFLQSYSSNSLTFEVHYPNSFQDSKAIRTMITDTVGGVASEPVIFDMSFRGSTVTVVRVTDSPDGRITSDPPGIDCPAVCTADFLGWSSVKLTQSVRSNSTEFIGWTGDCSGTDNPCRVSLVAPGPAWIPVNPLVTGNFKIHGTGVVTGVAEITLFRSNDTGDDQFVYKNPLLLFMPDDARISNVTNVSRDVNGNGVKLELVRHTDANGDSRSLPAANCPTAPLEPMASNSTFNGLTVRGEWKVRAVCISQVLLNPPARIVLSINWEK